MAVGILWNELHKSSYSNTAKVTKPYQKEQKRRKEGRERGRVEGRRAEGRKRQRKQEKALLELEKQVLFSKQEAHVDEMGRHNT